MDDQIRTLVESGELIFKGARKPTLGEGAYAILVRESARQARKTGKPGNACYREACAIYWKLYDERK